MEPVEVEGLDKAAVMNILHKMIGAPTVNATKMPVVTRELVMAEGKWLLEFAEHRFEDDGDREEHKHLHTILHIMQDIYKNAPDAKPLPLGVIEEPVELE